MSALLHDVRATTTHYVLTWDERQPATEPHGGHWVTVHAADPAGTCGPWLGLVHLDAAALGRLERAVAPQALPDGQKSLYLPAEVDHGLAGY